MSNNQNENKDNKLVVSQRFVREVEKQFTAEMGSQLQFTEHQKKLAQHLFLKVDSALKDFEADRIKKGHNNKLPFTWDNVNMRKMAIDAVDRVNLGLDALIENHIHPVPYFNSKIKKYDIELTIGYKGLDYYKRKCAVEEPIDIKYELVHETDIFKPIKKSIKNDVEFYEFEITNPFDRGPVIGGFGYIMYEDPTKNKLVIVTKEDFEKAKKMAQTKAIWNEHPEKMMYKTIVRRTTAHLDLDPEKTNAPSYARLEGESTERRVNEEIEANANTEYIDIEVEVEAEEQLPEPEPQEESPSPEEEDKPQGQPKQEQMSMEGPGF